MTPLRKKRAAEAAKTRREELKRALQLVSHTAMAPFERIRATMPKSYTGPAFDRWLNRQQEVAREVAAKLRAEGATITEGTSGTTVFLSGIRATSSMGLQGALRNWRKQATEKARA